MNNFADMTNEEFRKRLGRKKVQEQRNAPFTFLDEKIVPQTVDWRDQGAVNEV